MMFVTSGTWEQHIQDPRKVFQRIDESGLKIKRTKCVFRRAAVEFLGHKLGGRSNQTTGPQGEGHTGVFQIQDQDRPEGIPGTGGVLAEVYPGICPKVGRTDRQDGKEVSRHH